VGQEDDVVGMFQIEKRERAGESKGKRKMSLNFAEYSNCKRGKDGWYGGEGTQQPDLHHANQNSRTRAELRRKIRI
jgi:hypothetical protein